MPPSRALTKKKKKKSPPGGGGGEKAALVKIVGERRDGPAFPTYAAIIAKPSLIRRLRPRFSRNNLRSPPAFTRFCGETASAWRSKLARSGGQPAHAARTGKNSLMRSRTGKGSNWPPLPETLLQRRPGALGRSLVSSRGGGDIDPNRVAAPSPWKRSLPVWCGSAVSGPIWKPKRVL